MRAVGEIIGGGLRRRKNKGGRKTVVSGLKREMMDCEFVDKIVTHNLRERIRFFLIFIYYLIHYLLLIYFFIFYLIKFVQIDFN